MKINLELPELPYQLNALTPALTQETFEYHYQKHHLGYVNNLKALVKDTELIDLSVEQLIQHGFEHRNMVLFNNAAQHFNHSFYWNCLTPHSSVRPKGRIAELIDRDFGSFEVFKDTFSKIAVSLFGCGWAWLALNEQGKLEILAMKEANTPLTLKMRPILTIDVWEHAYYIDYRNARASFVESFWEIVNWDFANENLLSYE